MKKIIALVLALLMMCVFVGCNNSSDVAVIGGADDSDVVVDEVIDDTEEEPESYVRIDAFCDSDYNFYELSMTEYGEKATNNGIDVAGVHKENETVLEFLKRCDYTDLAFAQDYDGFMGWALYVMNDDSMDRIDDKLYTTDEMFEYIMPTDRICFVAQWEDTPSDIYESMGY